MTGDRRSEEGDFSGELFRDEVLVPKYKECLNKDECLEIVFLMIAMRLEQRFLKRYLEV